ncbi:MAG: ATP-binding protein, partial [Gammaproteobacteria bacterium]|nr:ATP-binding protein [Gammaproteobacteria bacterium]
MHPQLPFIFSNDATQTFGSFWAGQNVLLLEVLRHLAAGPGEDRQIFLSGTSGSGKTHLLTAACERATRLGGRIAYLAAASIVDAQVLTGLDDFDLVCIDDMQDLPSAPDTELALFNLINSLRENEGRLLLAANCVSAELNIGLPDLKTR